MAQFRELRRNGATDARQLRHESSETPTPELQPMAAGSDLPARYLASDPERWVIFPVLDLRTASPLAATILITDLVCVQYSCTFQEMNPGERR